MKRPSAPPVQRAGLNPYLCELVSIREQVSWVHTDKVAATAKSQGGGIRRRGACICTMNRWIRCASRSIPPRWWWAEALQASSPRSKLPNAGFHVYLVEREPSIGGHMAQFDKTFPTLDCSACILTPRMVEVGRIPNITLSDLERSGKSGWATWAISL